MTENFKINMSNAAQDTAKILIETGAVNVNFDNMFTLTSGRKSPVYVDCRRFISFPKERSILTQHMQLVLKEKLDETVDVIAGGETAGIPYAAFLADKMNLPMLYVRKKPKGFGRMAQIEGVFNKGDHVVLVEDMATDGGSKLLFVDALREADAKIEHCIVPFYYGIFDEGLKKLQDNNITMHYLATWWDVLAYAENEKIYTPETLSKLREFLENPQNS